MAQFQDGTGYLLELRDAVDQVWFGAVCDLAINSTGDAANTDELDGLFQLFQGRSDYQPPSATPRSSLPSSAVVGAKFISGMFDFRGFKKLSAGMRLSLDKQLTLIFGANGAGKSSICQALRVLASPERPEHPLQNVHTKPLTSPEFSYSLRGSASAFTWTESAGFGLLASDIKYFDSVVASRRVSSAVRPDEVVEISAFRLEVFDYARSIVSSFQTHAESAVRAVEGDFSVSVGGLKMAFAERMTRAPVQIAEWSGPAASQQIIDWLARLPPYSLETASREDDLRQELALRRVASSDEGLRGLQVRHVLLRQFQQELSALQELYASVSIAKLESDAIRYHGKLSAHAELANRVLPSRGHKDIAYQGLIHAASQCVEFSSIHEGATTCPLCERTVDSATAKLFAAYLEYLSSSLIEEIDVLGRELADGRRTLETILDFSLSDFSACADELSHPFLEALSAKLSLLKSFLPVRGGPFSTGNSQGFSGISSFNDEIEEVFRVVSGIGRAIDVGVNDRAGLLQYIADAERELEQIEMLKAMRELENDVSKLCEEGLTACLLIDQFRGYDFSSLLRSMSNKGKEAYTALVLGNFEKQLDTEYRALAGASLKQMGVRLASKASNQDVLVTTHVGGSQVNRVFSEGEQKVHALAVFMCEASVDRPKVLVLDDPVTSFDYNYVGNFCIRLRDYMKVNPETQIIVLTHNWDFFANLQSTVNKVPALSGKLSVQVLEACATVAEYVEKWTELCSHIELILNATTEPTTHEKESVAGLMRRLIERLTNQYVFNEQRHQYKVKTLSVSEFDKYTKIVPLLAAEAQALRDMFGALSPYEHDDVRNSYTDVSQAQLQTWYGTICSIRDAVASRRPS